MGEKRNGRSVITAREKVEQENGGEEKAEGEMRGMKARILTNIKNEKKSRWK